MIPDALKTIRSTSIESERVFSFCAICNEKNITHSKDIIALTIKSDSHTIVIVMRIAVRNHGMVYRFNIQNK